MNLDYFLAQHQHNIDTNTLVLFDLDHTLLPFDSDHSWTDYCIRLGWIKAPHFKERSDAFYAQYQAGTLDLDEYIAFSTIPLQERTPEELTLAHERYMQEVVLPQLSAQSQLLINHFAAAGCLLCVVTATNEFVVAPIVRTLGINHLIGIRLAKDTTGLYSGRIEGTPSFREGKVTRVLEWLDLMGCSLQTFTRSYFFSDSINDLPLLEAVTHPVLVDADATLSAIGKQRGWESLALHPRIESQ